MLFDLQCVCETNGKQMIQVEQLVPFTTVHVHVC